MRKLIVSLAIANVYYSINSHAEVISLDCRNNKGILTTIDIDIKGDTRKNPDKELSADIVYVSPGDGFIASRQSFDGEDRVSDQTSKVDRERVTTSVKYKNGVVTITESRVCLEHTPGRKCSDQTLVDTVDLHSMTYKYTSGDLVERYICQPARDVRPVVITR